MGDMANYIAMAIPVFFVLIGIEIWFARREAVEVARLNDAVSDLSCGTLQQLLGLFTKTAVFGVYALALPGGWIADRLIGQRKAVLYGGVLIAMGHYSMAAGRPTSSKSLSALVVVATPSRIW